MGKKSKPEKMPVPSIKITLTTFTDDENGQLAEAKNGMVKIDGEEESSKGVFFDFPIFKSVVVRNLFILSFGQFLLFMSFNCISNLQIIMNGKDNLGPISIAVVYGGLTISLFFLPTAVIKNFGCKKTLVIATACFCPFILANYHPTWASLIITAFLCGLTSGPLWIARSTYLNHISHRYAKLQKFAVGLINAWFFSVCTTFHQSTEIWGSLLSYYTLKFSHENESQFSNDDPEQCGPDLCYDGSYSINYDFSPPSEERWYILVTVLTALVLLATVFIAFFLDSLELEESSEIQKLKFSSTDLFATLYQFFDLDQMLLLPLSLYTGMVDGFYSGDYTKAYVGCTWGIPQVLVVSMCFGLAYIGCAWGIPHVLVVSLCFGVVSSLVDAACGPCVHVLGRGSLFVLAALAHLAMFLALLIWRPNSERIAGYFLVASAHGIGNGVWMSQLVALYGVLFRKNEEAAFSCHYFLNSLGYLLAYSYSNYFCTKTKIYIPMVILIVGLISYLAVEVRMVQRSLVEYRLRRPQEEID